MAICHISVSIISRGKGKSAVSAAAYRAGEMITSDYDGRIHNYLRRRGIIHKEIILPKYAPLKYKKRSELWNSAEMIERYKTAQLAREVVIALPVELTREQNIALSREYVQNNFVDAGMCADVCVHDTGEGNPHAHIMLTMRPIEVDGSWGQKSKSVNGRKIPSVDWSEQSKVEEWRKAWADIQNEYLKKLNLKVKVDHRSYERQGKYQVPTIHLGPSAFRLEKRGIRTVRGEYNRKAQETNKELRQLSARIKREKDNLYSLPLVDLPSALDAATRTRDWGIFRTKWQKTQDLKDIVTILNFITVNKIGNMNHVIDRAEKIYFEHVEVSNRIKAIDHRLNQIDTHKIKIDIYNKHMPLVRKYTSLSKNKKKQDSFYYEHQNEIAEYINAQKYLEVLMKGGKKLPIKEWETEKKKLYSERWHLCDKYYDLRKEIRAVELIRKGADKILGDIPMERDRQNQRQRSRGMDR